MYRDTEWRNDIKIAKELVYPKTVIQMLEQESDPEIRCRILRNARYGIYDKNRIDQSISKVKANTESKKPKPRPFVKVIETGEVYKTQRDAAKALGIGQTSIHNVLTGKQTSARGYHFKYVEG